MDQSLKLFVPSNSHHIFFDVFESRLEFVFLFLRKGCVGHWEKDIVFLVDMPVKKRNIASRVFGKTPQVFGFDPLCHTARKISCGFVFLDQFFDE